MQQNKELFIPALKKIMTEFNIKTPAMAKEAGLSEADGKNLASYISGKRTFPLKKLEQIFVAFGVEIKVKYYCCFCKVEIPSGFQCCVKCANEYYK